MSWFQRPLVFLASLLLALLGMGAVVIVLSSSASGWAPELSEAWRFALSLTALVLSAGGIAISYAYEKPMLELYRRKPPPTGATATQAVFIVGAAMAFNPTLLGFFLFFVKGSATEYLFFTTVSAVALLTWTAWWSRKHSLSS